jgi:antitoxin YefM
MTTLSLADAEAHLSKLVARVSGQHERVSVTVHGKPSAVLLATEDLESLEETSEILADADAVQRLHASEAELARGEVEKREELAAAMPRRRSQRQCRRSGVLPSCLHPDCPSPAHRPTPRSRLRGRPRVHPRLAARPPQPRGPGLPPPLGDRHSVRCGTYRVVHRHRRRTPEPSPSSTSPTGATHTGRPADSRGRQPAPKHRRSASQRADAVTGDTCAGTAATTARSWAGPSARRDRSRGLGDHSSPVGR